MASASADLFFLFAFVVAFLAALLGFFGDHGNDLLLVPLH
jgi:hypothetical protein